MASALDLEVFAYGPDTVEEARVRRAQEARDYVGRFPVVWINLNSVASYDQVQEIGQAFGLHPLALEDVRKTHQRPKVEPYGDYIYLVLRMTHLVPQEDEPGSVRVHSEQLSLFLGKGWLITFQETPGDVWDWIRDRIRTPGANVRTRGADYLVYRLIDAIVDSLFPVLEHMGDRLETLEERIYEDPTKDTQADLHDVKRDLVRLRRVVWPTRDALIGLDRLETALIERETRTFLRDPADHVLRATDLLESYREIAADLRDLYLAEINTRASEVMKVLTMVATIFIPLTFVAGVYGMNFEHMPELAWRWGYPVTLGFMGVVAAGMLIAFRRRGWL